MAGRCGLQVLHTDQFYVGSEINDRAGPFGTGPDITIHSWEFTLNYGLSNRVNLALRFPFAAGTVSRLYADLNRHRKLSLANIS
jgi:hypothetical protein